MTEREICGSYIRAKNQNEQITILTELTLKSREQIIGILLKNGVDIPTRITEQLWKRLEKLEQEISEREREYKEIANALKGIV